jgi:hypothetical protein
MEQSPPWKGNSPYAGQEILHNDIYFPLIYTDKLAEITDE